MKKLLLVLFVIGSLVSSTPASAQQTRDEVYNLGMSGPKDKNIKNRDKYVIHEVYEHQSGHYCVVSKANSLIGFANGKMSETMPKGYIEVGSYMNHNRKCDNHHHTRFKKLESVNGDVYYLEIKGQKWALEHTNAGQKVSKLIPLETKLKSLAYQAPVNVDSDQKVTDFVKHAKFDFKVNLGHTEGEVIYHDTDITLEIKHQHQGKIDKHSFVMINNEQTGKYQVVML